jgi:hypothetical protein
MRDFTIIAVFAGVRCIDKPVMLAQEGFYCTSFDQEPLYLLLNHENYDAIFSMAMSAAINGVSFTIRITGGKSASGHDLVEYATMNFPLPK